jgi:hypothetical protein
VVVDSSCPSHGALGGVLVLSLAASIDFVDQELHVYLYLATYEVKTQGFRYYEHWFKRVIILKVY